MPTPAQSVILLPWPSSAPSAPGAVKSSSCFNASRASFLFGSAAAASSLRCEASMPARTFFAASSAWPPFLISSRSSAVSPPASMLRSSSCSESLSEECTARSATCSCAPCFFRFMTKNRPAASPSTTTAAPAMIPASIPVLIPLSLSSSGGTSGTNNPSTPVTPGISEMRWMSLMCCASFSLSVSAITVSYVAVAFSARRAPPVHTTDNTLKSCAGFWPPSP
mmetsp:Transcript_15520/g.24342  ORF Transcript_15520/g.24342 Transcript_15520/m.24342 type:complete len:223 (+) Transcript_15520:178-846(+)